MPRVLPSVVLLSLIAAILAGCVAGALRPPRRDALPGGTSTLPAPAASEAITPAIPVPAHTVAASPSPTTGAGPGPKGIVTATTTVVRPQATAAASALAVSPPPPATDAYPPPETAAPYAAPTGLAMPGLALLPMVVRPGAGPEPPSPQIPSIAAAVPAGFVQASGPNLVLDGEPFYFLGVNASYLMSEYFPEREIEPIIRYLAETGGVNVIRLFYQPGKDPEHFARILDLGRQYGIRFIVALQDFYFYKTQTWFDVHYKEEDLPHIRAVVPRFRDRPEILMWELMNEPGCAEGDDPKQCQQHIYNWAVAVSAEIKALDPYHLVSIGALSAEGSRYHKSNYEKMHELPTVDVISLHRYVGKTSRTEMRLAAGLGKPIYVGEAWEKAYKRDRCEPIDGTILGERAEKVADDLEWSFEHGLDGYLVWQHDPEAVVMEDGDKQWYCSEFSFLEGDPAYAVLREYLARIRAGEGIDSQEVDDD
jgi:hypothetical protein